ncbi:hypothetical protein BDZ97DRAFT_1683873 [Flammula alnicola]|nr:hypothetical protein BDZ97DRAFT_1683873 [Flammula alnicola]
MLDAAEERKRLEREAIEFDLWHDSLPEQDLNIGESVLDELEREDVLTELLQNAHLDQPDAADLLNEELGGAHQPQTHDAWFPYESKTMFLLDTLDNLPRMKISNSLMKVLLWILREVGARDVPTLYRLRQVQATLRKTGVPTIQHKSPKGNIYSINDPRTLDWANPTVCDYIRRYPVIPPDGVISEVYHAQKWMEVDPHVLSPMYDAGNCHYYIDELAVLKNGKFIIPLRWLEDTDRKVFADAYSVKFNSLSVASVDDSKMIRVQASDLEHNFLDLNDMQLALTWDSRTITAGYPARMPNPDRALAEGDPLYTSWIDVFGDDVSGNISKSYNKHSNIYLSHRNLPRKLLQQEFHVHFVSTSPVASVPEQFHGIKQAIESTHKKPVKVRHGTTGASIRFKIYVNSEPGDNPAQSEVSGHIGGNGNHLCRKCDAGGTKEVKQSDDGYHQLFKLGSARSGAAVLSEVKSQVKLACLGVAAKVDKQQTATGIKDAYTQFWIDHLIERARTLKKENPHRTDSDIQKDLLQWVEDRKSDIYNPYLELDGFDPVVDTPVEILHTILLGVVKYLWHGSHTSWTPHQKQTYSVRLQSTNTSGLSIHAIRANYIMQYPNSLIGRQLKTIAQVNVFHVYDLVDNTQFLLTKAVGELAALLWFPEIRDMKEYLSDVEIAAANVLDLFAMIDPSKMTNKMKLHLLAHLKEDILRFGPLVGTASETFECFNAIFRFCSIFSNHLSPSRDIALQLAGQELLKHRLTGGWWPTEDGEWRRPGPSVRNFIRDHPTLQAFVGWTSDKPLFNGNNLGSVRLEPLKRGANQKIESRKYVPWCQTQGAKAINASEDPNSQWTPCRSAIGRYGDNCLVGSWIFATSPFNRQESVTGRIVEIWSEEKNRAVVILDIFKVCGTRHKIFGMPMLARPDDKTTYIVIPTIDIEFLYNVQHDCVLAKCTASGKQALMQERVESGVFDAFIEHKPIDRFVINTHAFHNAHLLRASLDHSLVVPVLLYPPEERRAKHTEFAQTLRRKQAEIKARAEQKKQLKKHESSTPAGTSSLSRKRARLELEAEARADDTMTGV